MKVARSHFRLAAAAAASLMFLALPCGAAPTVQAPPVAVLTPGQAAFMQAETRRIEEAFVQKVMNITGATREQVVRAIPAKGRLTDRLTRIYNSLERDLKTPLTDEQQGLIYAADGERKQALKELPAQAAGR